MYTGKKSRHRGSAAARILGVALSASMALGLVPAEGLAWARAEAVGRAGGEDGALVLDGGLPEDEGIRLVSEDEAVEVAGPAEPTEAGGPAAAKETGVPEWAVDDDPEAAEPKLTAQAALPSRYDLRDDGFVTPVKLQTPWQTCWAFAGIAAAETSILSSAGATYAGSNVDLSERHLAWFALHPVTEEDDPDQAGEGTRLVSDDPHAAYDVGGRAIYITTLFSQGVGPMPESLFPYRGVGTDGTSHFVKALGISLAEFDKDPEQGVLFVIADEIGGDKNAARQTLEQMAQTENKSYEEKLAELEARIRSNIIQTSLYSRDDDWTIPATDANGNSNRTYTAFQVLKDGNVLPEYLNDDKTPNEASITAMKQELVNGHGVSIAYRADVAQPGQNIDSTYMNQETCAQYTFDPLDLDHAVCIVGYDDNFDKSSFYHTVYKKDKDGKVIYEDGQPVEDTEGTAKSTPPGNGAWIVKNSWGSETDITTDDLGNSVGAGLYGIPNAEDKRTGYFYLSYYDKSIQNPETMTFSANLLGSTGTIDILQHDYMPATGGFYTTEFGQVASSANVFEVPQDTEVKGISTRTSEENQRVTFAIYLLSDGATSPVDGDLLWQTSSNFEHAGFHRMDVDQPIAVSAGQKVSVVSTVSKLDESTGKRIYSVSANQGLTKEAIDQLKSYNINLKTYSTAIVNEGESFLYKDGAWVDWGQYLAGVPALSNIDGLSVNADSYTDLLAVDNFSIKLYATPAEHAHEFSYSASGATITATCGGPGVCDVGDTELTVVAPADLTYDGRAKAATVAGGGGAFPAAPEVRYLRGGREVAAGEVVGAGDYVAEVTCGGATASAAFAIEPAEITGIAAVADKTFSGKAVTPRPAVTSGSARLRAGTDFEYSWKANAAPGTATVTATGRGNYRGTASTTFRIELARAGAPGTVARPSKGQVEASWKAVKGAKAYQLEWRQAGAKRWATEEVKGTSATVSGLRAGALYNLRVRAVAGEAAGAWSAASRRWLRTVTGAKASAGKERGSVKVTWKADKSATGGYRVFVYDRKGGAAVASRTAKAGATSATVKGLKPGKTYYVRVRPYRLRSGATYVGALSGYKAAKAK